MARPGPSHSALNHGTWSATMRHSGFCEDMSGNLNQGPVKVIGVACSANQQHVGIAVGIIGTGRPRLIQPQARMDEEECDATVAKWMAGNEPVLLAFDTPLGWPVDFAPALKEHRAGERLSTTPDRLFRRLTDAQIQSRLGKGQLEVGASCIARTAYAALDLLQAVRERTGLAIPLAWDHTALKAAHAIEVCPAATLKSCRQLDAATAFDPAATFKELIKRRRALVAQVLGLFDGNADSNSIVGARNRFEAVVCVLAGAHFLRGEAVPPEAKYRQQAAREGWIWARRIGD